MTTTAQQDKASSNGHSTQDDEIARQWIAALLRGELTIFPLLSTDSYFTELRTLERVYKANPGNLVPVQATHESFLQSKPAYARMFKGKPKQPDPPPAREEDEVLIPSLPESAQLSEGLSNGASPWLDQYIAFSKKVSPEGYEDFHEACGISLLSTVAGRRVAIPFAERQYTPLIITLVARTSLYKKTTTTKVVKTVLRAANLDWLLGADETTPQKLLTDMAGNVPVNYSEFDENKQDRTKKRLGMSGQRGWVYDELGQLVKSMLKKDGYMQEFKKLLLTLDSCDESYTYTTQRRGDEQVEKPYLSLLGSMTPSCIKDTNKTSDFWSDGFWARFAFVCPPPDTSLDAPMSLGSVPVPMELIKSLITWHETLGEPVVDIKEIRDKKGDPTGKFDVSRASLPEQECMFGEGVFDAWVRYRSALKVITTSFKNTDFDGWYDRLPIKAIRIAALLASLENNGIIEMRHWAKAQEIAERWRVSLHHLYAQSHMQEERESSAAQLEEQIIKRVKQLETSGQAPTARDVKCYFKKYSTSAIADAMKAMARSGVLVEVKSKKASRYKLAGDESPPTEDTEDEFAQASMST